KKNTRYNIGYAERKGEEVKTYSLEDENIDEKLSEFYDLLEEMQERSSGYPIRSKKYFKKLFKEFKGTDSIVLFEVSYKGDVIAMNISEFTDVWASSFYAGSNRLHRKVKAPYQLRWQSIKEAKERGCKVYDFWGIIPDSKHHKGYSDHKLSFGGDRVDYVGIIRYSIVWKAYLYEMAIKFHQLTTRLVWR
ncbi:GNAT family N-acetyltransferase, partial [Candidatus Dojkabacteria bacterium]|nr:GNAT family N-acetyltransferase [Candidatus Dojkabacteria bacterium]